MTMSRELITALMVSVIALFVDTTLLKTLTQYTDLSITSAASLAFIAGAVTNWALSVRFVFKYRRYQSRAYEFMIFMAIGVITLIVNDTVIVFVVKSLSQDILVGKGLSAVVTFAINFCLRKVLLFSSAKAKNSWDSQK